VESAKRALDTAGRPGYNPCPSETPHPAARAAPYTKETQP